MGERIRKVYGENLLHGLEVLLARILGALKGGKWEATFHRRSIQRLEIQGSAMFIIRIHHFYHGFFFPFVDESHAEQTRQRERLLTYQVY